MDADVNDYGRWLETSKPYRILAQALALRRSGKLETDEGRAWMALAKQTEQAMEQDPTLTDYGRFRLRGYQRAMRG